jgi:hypothetical protein
MDNTTFIKLAAWIGPKTCYNEGRLIGDGLLAASSGAVTTYNVQAEQSR